VEKNFFGAYINNIVISILLLLLSTALFNRIMNPYSVFDGPSINGVNIKKPAFQSHLRLAKSMEVSRIKPTAISLGTSRTERGIDPNHAGWSENITYNLGLSGATIYEAYRYMQHAHNTNPLDKVVLMLDLIMFDASRGKSVKGFDEQRLLVSNDKFESKIYINDILLSLFTLDAFIDSVEVLTGQDNAQKYLNNGMHDPLYEKNNYVVQHRKSFNMMNEGYYSKYKKLTLKSDDVDTLKVYEDILNYASEKNIELFIGISPVHAQLLETMYVSGKWKMFERWKMDLVKINEKISIKYGKSPYQLVDFSGYNKYTTEKVPLKGDYTSEMQWYWESSHYKKELGDLVLCHFFKYKSLECSININFGNLLSTLTIDDHLEKIRSNRKNWILEFPIDKNEINSLEK
jgi:hypothetical protein